MPKGNPSRQTIATEKYQKKVGLRFKGFKLRKEVIEAFVETCQRTGESQASVITRYMKQYIEENREGI